MNHDSQISNVRIGPLMINVEGTSLTESDIDRLKDPRVGGLILFSRNYVSREQLAELITSIRELTSRNFLISVDHEGGRVQRFREGFTVLPPMRKLGELYDCSPGEALDAAAVLGGLLAAELAEFDIDFSFTPVLDLDLGQSEAIGSRAFHSDPDVVANLAAALIAGLKQSGMAAVGKHFPGHGHVNADSHLELPVDTRELDSIRQTDLIPFQRLAADGLAGVMPAHVLFNKVDASPAGFSRFWIQEVLRTELGFEGAVFSDDLSMQGAASAGSPVDRVKLAFEAGCDMMLVCNDPAAVDSVLGNLQFADNPQSSERLRQLLRRQDQQTKAYCKTVQNQAGEILDKLA